MIITNENLFFFQKNCPIYMEHHKIQGKKCKMYERTIIIDCIKNIDTILLYRKWYKIINLTNITYFLEKLITETLFYSSPLKITYNLHLSYILISIFGRHKNSDISECTI